MNEIIQSRKKRYGKLGSPFKLLSIIYLCVIAFLAIAFAASIWLEVPIEKFTADPAYTFNAHPLTGVISYTGVLLWCSSAAICLFSFMLLRIKGERVLAPFLLFSGLISLVLLIDDLFMFHEFIFPRYLHLPQNLVYLGYFILVSWYLFYFREKIITSEYKILIVALVLLAISALCDMVIPQQGIAYFIEDGFKILGIATWFIYFFRLCLHTVTFNSNSSLKNSLE